jgi:hypothetical protein
MKESFLPIFAVFLLCCYDTVGRRTKKKAPLPPWNGAGSKETSPEGRRGQSSVSGQ